MKRCPSRMPGPDARPAGVLAESRSSKDTRGLCLHSRAPPAPKQHELPSPDATTEMRPTAETKIIITVLNLLEPFDSLFELRLFVVGPATFDPLSCLDQFSFWLQNRDLSVTVKYVCGIKAEHSSPRWGRGARRALAN